MTKTGFWQNIYDSIKNWKTPVWLKVMLQEIQDILISIAIQVGKEYIENLQSKIIEVSALDIPNDEKFGIVFNFGKTEFPNIKDSYLNMLIEVIVNRLKTNRVI